MSDPTLSNPDLVPTTAAQRTWRWYHFAALWVGMVMCIPAYTLAASLIESGMSWSQAVGTVFLGNLIVLLPMLLIGHAGAKYGIPYAVLARASFGTQGARLPALLRALGSARRARGYRPCCGHWWPAAGTASRPGSAAR